MHTVAVHRDKIFKQKITKILKDPTHLSPYKTQYIKPTYERKPRILSFQKIVQSTSTDLQNQTTFISDQKHNKKQSEKNSVQNESKLESVSPLKKIAAKLLEIRKNNLITLDSKKFINVIKVIEKYQRSPDLNPNSNPKKLIQKGNQSSLMRKTFCSSFHQQQKNKSLQMQNIQLRPPTSQTQDYRPTTRIRKVSNIGQESNKNFLAKYEIIKQLGKGTYGTVFLAKKIKNDHQKMMNKTSFLSSFKLVTHESQNQQGLERSSLKQLKQEQALTSNHVNQQRENQIIDMKLQSVKQKDLKFQQNFSLSLEKNQTSHLQNINFNEIMGSFSQDNQFVAIKVYQKFKMNKDPSKFKNIRKEITIMQNLSHEGVIKLYESVESITKISLVVQFGGQLSLLDYLKKNFPLSTQKLKLFTKQILQTIVYIHDKNIVHRDIKPQNILVKIDTKRNNLQKLKLIDFGFSTLTNKSRKLNVICGTPNFMAPQLLNSKQYYGQKADIWSFGVVVFVMAEGRHPFKSADYQELARMTNKGKYIFKRKHDQFFQQFISQILKVNGQQRPTASQILKHKWLQQP